MLRSAIIVPLIVFLLVGVFPVGISDGGWRYVPGNGVVLADGSVEVYVRPVVPKPYKPIALYIRHSGGGRPFNISFASSTMVDAEYSFDEMSLNETGLGYLCVYVEAPFQLSRPAYVVVTRAVSTRFTIIAAGITRDDGRVCFTLSLAAVARVAAFYDYDGDGLYDYVGDNTTSVTLTGSSVEVRLSPLREALFNTTLYSINAWVPAVPVRNDTDIAVLPSAPAAYFAYPGRFIIGPGGVTSYWYLRVMDGLLYINVSSTITYTVRDSAGSVVAGDTIAVEPVNLTDTPPFLIMARYPPGTGIDELLDTLHLSVPGWSHPADTGLDLVLIGFDDNSTVDISLTYRVNDGEWEALTLTGATGIYRLLETRFNESLSIINTGIVGYVLQGLASRNITRGRLRALASKLKVCLATIPGQPPGSVVEYNASIDDGAHHISTPIHVYYVYNTVGERILIYDPSLRLYWARYNALLFLDEYLLSVIREYADPVVNETYNVSLYGVELGGILRITRHYWEYLAENYNITIVTTPSMLNRALDGDYRVLVLSNVYLGINATGTTDKWIKELFDWDLGDYPGLLDKLINYVTTRHTGVIATHGTLSDWVITMYSDDGSTTRVKIMGRSMIGGLRNIRDTYTGRPGNLPMLLGMPLIPVWEELRDQAAQALADAQMYPVAAAVASTPLQVPYVPWNGTLFPTPETRYVGWSIPGEPITVPSSPYGNYSYTQVGWQLSVGRALLYTAGRRLNESRSRVSRWINESMAVITRRYIQYLNETNISHVFDEAVKRVLGSVMRAFYTPLITRDARYSLRVNGTRVVVGINASRIAELLARYMPLKLVALSPRGLAGIVLYDRYWDDMYYRSVYMSFEPEASPTNAAKSLLLQAVEWSMNATQRSILRELYGLLVTNRTLETHRFILNRSRDMRPVINTSSVVAEGATTLIEINSTPGKYYRVIITHPLEKNISYRVSGATITSTYIMENITVLDLVAASTTIDINITINSTAPYQAVHIEVYESDTAPEPLPENPFILTIYITIITLTLAHVILSKKNSR